MELYEKGYLKESEIGMPLPWGDGAALVKLTRMTARREGFGNILAEGSRRLAARCGHPELAMVAKSLDFAGYDPRGEQGMGLAYATSPIGGSHMRGDPAYFELLGVPVPADPHTWEDKPPLVAKWQDLFSVIDAAGLCVFFSVRYLVEQNLMVKPVGITELLNGATGAGYSPAEVERAGERIFNAERLFLLAAGFTRKDDSLPPRITREPMPAGPAKGLGLPPGGDAGALLQTAGLGPRRVPSEAKLKELGVAVAERQTALRAAIRRRGRFPRNATYRSIAAPSKTARLG